VPDHLGPEQPGDDPPVTGGKLVRDRIPELIEADGGHPVTRVLDAAGYRRALVNKLVEEAGEAQDASADELPAELADVLEVLRALADDLGMTWEDLARVADRKRGQRGGFARRLFLESAD